jgi:hypothetical protein
VSGQREHAITVELDAWAHEELERAARARAIAPAKLAAYAIAYYLADEDSGRVARRTVPPGLGAEPPPD